MAVKYVVSAGRKLPMTISIGEDTVEELRALPRGRGSFSATVSRVIELGLQVARDDPSRLDS